MLKKMPRLGVKKVRKHIKRLASFNAAGVWKQQPEVFATLIDSWTRWLEAVPKTDITSISVCSELMSTWIARFGPPLTLTTDRETQFCSKMTEQLNEIPGIHHIRTTAFKQEGKWDDRKSTKKFKGVPKASWEALDGTNSYYFSWLADAN